VRQVTCPRCKQIIDADQPCAVCFEYRASPPEGNEVAVAFSCSRCMARGFAAVAAWYQTAIADCPRCGGKMRWHADLNRFLTCTEDELASLSRGVSAVLPREINGGVAGGTAMMSFHSARPKRQSE